MARQEETMTTYGGLMLMVAIAAGASLQMLLGLRRRVSHST